MIENEIEMKRNTIQTTFNSSIKIIGKFTSSYKDSNSSNNDLYPTLNLSSYMGSYSPETPNRP